MAGIFSLRVRCVSTSLARIGSRASGMRVRLSDAATSAVLAEHYRMQAEVCHQMARITVSPVNEVWLELAAEWTKLAREREEVVEQR
jgi:hypothetical protein